MKINTRDNSLETASKTASRPTIWPSGPKAENRL